VNAGYGWQNNDNNSFFVPARTFVTAPLASGIVSFAEDDGDGFVGGAQVGYNFQFGSFVAGVEADLQWADLGGSDGTAFVPAGFPPTFVAAGAAGGVDWFVYATGGFAYGGADTDDDFGLINNSDDVRTGWVLGGGVEYAITNNLTLGLEGLWVNLDGGDNNGTFVGTEVIGGVTTPVFALGADRGEDENDFFVARAKLNFKF
jgi:outer membrane immunogenic protein